MIAVGTICLTNFIQTLAKHHMNERMRSSSKEVIDVDRIGDEGHSHGSVFLVQERQLATYAIEFSVAIHR
jgi:hypothetical protein